MTTLKKVLVCGFMLLNLSNAWTQIFNKLFVEEKVYDGTSVVREIHGNKEYYIVRNATKKQIEFYNDKHVLVKTVAYPNVPKANIFPTFITQTIFNADDNFEIIYSLRDSVTSKQSGLVLTESGDTIFKANGFIIYTLPGGTLERKIFVRNMDMQGNVTDIDVYNFKTFALEKNLKYSLMNLTKLEYSGQKYWAYNNTLDNGELVFNFLNTDFTVYKTLRLPFPNTVSQISNSQAAFIFSDMSEKIFSNDSTISLIYRSFYYPTSELHAYLFNEKKKVQLESLYGIDLSSIAGLPNELIYVRGDNKGSVVSLPNLTPKLDFDVRIVKRGNFKSYGAAYYGLDFIAGASKINVYRNDGNLLKSIPFPSISSTSTSYSLDYVTDTVFNKNNLLEFSFEEIRSGGQGSITHIVDENGAPLLRYPNLTLLRPAFFDGFSRKYIANLQENGVATKRIVFSELPTATQDLSFTIDVKIYPNPFLESLNIRLDDTHQTIKSIQIMDTKGQVLIHKNTEGSTIELTGLNDLANGYYLLQINLTESVVVKRIVKM